MVSLGYNTEAKTDTSLTMVQAFKPDRTMTCLMYVIALFTLGAALLVLLVFTQLKVRVTVAAMSTPPGTSLTLGGSDQGIKEVSSWIEQSLTRVAAV